MKKFFKQVQFLVCISLSVCTLQSCDLDINENPNQADKIDVSTLLAPQILKLATYESFTLNELGAVFGGQWGNSSDNHGQVIDLVSYNITPSFYTSVWEEAYVNIYNIKSFEDSESGINPAYTGIGKILRGWYYLRLVDHYNNVPFSEASIGNKIDPKYDKGEDVYHGAINLITEGISLLHNVPNGSKRPTSNDILFNGDLVSWMKLGNTVKLRALIRQSEVADATYITSEIQKIIQEGSGYITDDALVNPKFVAGNTNQMNPFWLKFYRQVDGSVVSKYLYYRPTKTLIKAYEENNDPRLDQNYVKVNGSHYAGVDLGVANNDLQNAGVTSALKGPQEGGGKGLLKSASQSLVLLSASESYFLQAEAAMRGWITSETVASLYNKAITASMTYHGVTQNDITTFLAKPQVVFTSTSSIYQIITQKWIALNGINGAEAWADYRRLGHPVLQISLSSNGVWPLRLAYPDSEYSRNAKVVNAEGNIIGTTSKVFWQK